MKLTTSSNAGHLAMFQTVIAVSLRPSTPPTSLARPPVSVTATALTASSTSRTSVRTSRALRALQVPDRAREDVLGGTRGDLAEVVDQRLRRRVPDQPQHRHQHEQRREDRKDAVVGQRGRPVGQVVLLELPNAALEHGHPGTARQVRWAIGRALAGEA